MGNLSDNDIDQAAEPYNLEPLPKGRYLAKLVDSELKINSKNTGLVLRGVWEVLDSEFAKRKLFSNFNVKHTDKKAERIGLGMLSSCSKACGKPSIPDDSSELHNIPHIVAVKVVDGQGRYGAKNEITGFYPAKANAAPPLVEDDVPFVKFPAGENVFD